MSLGCVWYTSKCKMFFTFVPNLPLNCCCYGVVCWFCIEENLRLLLLLILYAEEFILTEMMSWSQKKTALFWLSEVNDGLTLRLKDINSLVRRTSLGKNNNKYKRIGYQWKPSPTSPMVQIWVLICWEWSSTIAKIWDASGKRFVSDYSRRSETSTISSFR